MAIERIKTLDKLGIHDKGMSISFLDSNIVTIIGMNGSGKTLFLKNLVEKINVPTNSSNSYVDIERKLYVQDIAYILDSVIDKDILNDKSKSHFSKLKETLIKQEIISEEIFWKYFSKMYCEKFTKYLKGNEDILQNEQYEIFNNFFCDEKKSNIKDLDKNLSDLLNQQKNLVTSYIQGTKKLLEEFQLVKKVFEDRIGNINGIYIDTITDKSPIVFNSNIYFDYKNNDNVMYVSSRTFIDFRILYNFLMNSSVKPKEFMKMSVDKILELNNNDEFHNSYNMWIKSFLSQKLIFKIKFVDSYRNGYTYYYRNAVSNINCEIEIFDERNKTKLSYDDLSSGTKVLFKIMNKISKINNQSLIIIDEPETGMHPMMQIQFREYLFGLSYKTEARFIIATHSMFLLRDGSSTKGLYICERTKHNGIGSLNPYEEYRKKYSDDIQIFEAIEYMPFGNEIKLSEHGPNIIVEGETDVFYLKKMACLFKLNIPNDLQVLKSTIRPGGYSGMIKTRNKLSVLYDKNIEKLFLCPDADVEEKDPKQWSEFKKEKNFVPIGKTKSSIESFFEGNDKKLYASKTKKVNRANYFYQHASLENLNSETINNFREWFKKIGIKINK